MCVWFVIRVFRGRGGSCAVSVRAHILLVYVWFVRGSCVRVFCVESVVLYILFMQIII